MEQTKNSEILASWKCRCHALGNLTTNRPGLTGVQLRDLFDLTEKKEKKGLTVIQQAKLDELWAKRKKPDELPTGAKTYLRDEYFRLIYGIEHYVQSKELWKGIACEDDSLELLKGVYESMHGKSAGFIKNHERRQNDWFTGEIDSQEGKAIIDTKSSWNEKSHSGAEFSTDNYWQLQGYLDLWEKAEIGIVANCLVDTPEELIYDAFRRACWQEGVMEDSPYAVEELEPKIRSGMMFSHIPEANRVICFTTERSEDDILFARSRVELAREYLCQFHVYLMQYKPNLPLIKY